MVLVLVIIAAGLWLVMAAAWLFQRAVGNGGWVDVFWTFGTGLACAAAALAPISGHDQPTARQVLVAALAAVWSLRLGGYMALRVARSAEDARYVQFRREWGADFQRRMFFFLQNQAIGSLLFPLSALVAARHPAPGLRLADWIGVAIMAIAIAGETLADRQMRRFKAAAGDHAVCDVGLWAWSRHPNYFFEWLGWFAYPAIAIDLTGAYWAGLLALAAPALMYAVLNYGTGIPPLEAHMARSRGEAWLAYRARTNAFVPWRPVGPG